MRRETLLLICNPPRILLGLKNPEKKFGGLWNGWGGGIEEDETPEQAVIREINEEGLGIKPVNPEKKGEILFHFDNGEQDHYVHIFSSESYTGLLVPSRDFSEYKVFNINKLPEKMMPADKYWIPFLANRGFFKGEIYLRSQGKPKVNIREVNFL